MTNESPKSDELFELLSELVDGELTPSRSDRLRELLRDDPDAQDLYVKFMGLHAQLHLDYAAGAGPADMPGGSLSPPSPLYDPALDEARDLVATGFSEPPPGPARSWLASAAAGWALAVLFAIGLVAVLRSPGPQKAPTVNAPAGKIDVADGVAVVVRAENVRWEMSGNRIPKEGDVLPRGRLQIREGRATFSMFSGVAVTVEGPAEIDLLSINLISCKSGKLRARVPEGAEGFAISGPGTAVVDLGTEFGVNIKANGKSRGQVFEGEVEAGVLGMSGTLRHSEVVKKGSGAFEIDPGSGLIGPVAGTEDFVAPFVPTPESLALAPTYRDTVLRSRPRCYWRFETEQGGRFPSEVPDSPSLLATGPIWLARTAPGNRCAVFEGGQHNQYLEMDGFWKPDRSMGYAVELWFLPETIGLSSLISMVAPKNTTHHLSLVELTSSNQLALYRPASIRFLYRWPTGRGGGDNIFSNDIYVPYRWHHLVSQVAGERMEMYLDGALQTSQVIGTGGSTAPCQFLLGRLTTLVESTNIHHTGFRRAFVGLMDEVAVYDRPLTAEEIRGHYRLARRSIARAD